MFDENQLFVVFKFEESGCDLESFKVLVHTSFVTFTKVSKRYRTFLVIITIDLIDVGLADFIAVVHFPLSVLFGRTV